MALEILTQRAQASVSRDVIRGKSVTVTVQRGTYAASRVRKDVRDVDRAVAQLSKLLDQKVPADLLPIAVTLDDGSAGTPEEHGAAWVAAPTRESTAAYLVGPVVERLLSAWFDGVAEKAPFVVSGLIAAVAGRIGDAPPRSAAVEAAQAEQAAGTLSLPALWERRDQPLLAHAFILYLLEIASGRELCTFLGSYNPSRRDEAAMRAYQRPLAALQSGWVTQLQRKASSGSALGSLLRYVGAEYRPFWGKQVEIILYMLLNLAFGLSFPIGSKYLIDTVIPGQNVQLLVTVIGIMLLNEVLNALLGLRRAYVTNWLNGQVTNKLQGRVFVHLQRLPHRFYANARVGDLLTRLSSDVQVIQGALAQILGIGLFMILRIVVVVITMITLSPILGVVVLVAVPLFASIYFGLRTRLQGSSKRMRSIYGEVAATTQESLSAHSIIKAFGLEERTVSNYRNKLNTLLGASLGMVVNGSLFETSVTIAAAIGQLVILGIGGYLVLQGQSTVGTLLALISLLPSVFQPIAMLSSIAQTVEQTAGSLDRFKELLETPVEIEDREGADAITTIDDAIRFDGVEFAYEKGRQILSDLSLTLPAGKHIAIVGPSGSGKSTLVNLLLRFWDPDQGRITIDGHDLRDLTLESLRGIIGIVFQDTFVFDSTLRENIAIGRLGATDDDVWAAANSAQLGSYIESLPNGIDTELGERGVRMSGGQRQRLAIARVILRDPRLLILDEATSALDAQTERDILDTFLELAHGRTTISITHRLTLAAAADWIVVLDSGKVVEQGTHEELLRQGGLYHSLYQEQFGHPTGRLMRSEEAALLRSVPLFATVGDNTLASLVSNIVTEYFPADSVIVRQGDPGDKLYIIKQGQVEVSVRYGDIEHVVTQLGPQDYFGEMTLLSENRRTATVRALVPTELYTLTHADFLTMLGQSADLRTTITSNRAVRYDELTALQGADASGGGQ